MKTFAPGVIVHKFISKSGDEVVIRFPQLSDVPALTEYINTVSAEDTYITFSGEQVTEESERVYLTDQLYKMDCGDSVMLLATVNGLIVGNAGVNRNEYSRRRARHIGIFGISVKKEYRGQGIGYELARCTVQEAALNVDNIRMLTLTVYSPNEKAHSLYKKIGFVDYGVLPGGVWYKDQFIDEILMYLPVNQSM
jgi:RimJ/RimL family protein N-acetyltransferase